MFGIANSNYSTTDVAIILDSFDVSLSMIDKIENGVY